MLRFCDKFFISL